MAARPITPPSAFQPAQLGPLRLRNRIVKAATFEGVMPKGAVSDELVAFHRTIAAGGVGMTTVAYCAIAPGGRVQRNGIVLEEGSIPGLRRLTDAVHDEGAAIAAQVGHAGYVANYASNKVPSVGPSTRLSPAAGTVVKAASESQIDQLVEQYRAAAKVAVESGFDAIELHLGHNYLLSSFLSPNLNRRKDRYGGSIENRLRFPRRVIEAVREAIGPDRALTAKFNMADGVPKGLWLEESLPMARQLEADGHLDALELTGGSSLLNGMYFFRGDVPMEEFIATQPKVVGWGLRVMGHRIFPTYPFEEGFFLPFAREFRAALEMPLILLGGINRRETIETAMAEGFEFVAMGRALLREPDLPRKLAEGATDAALCVHCNKCMPTIYTGTHCVLAPDSLR